MPLDAIASFVLVLALGTVFLMVILMRQNRTRTDLPIWLTSGVVGLLLGGAVSVALVKGMGYDLILTSNNVDYIPGQPDPSNPQTSTGGSPPAGGMMGMGGGMGMGMGMGGGMGGGQPNPKRQLTTLVRKLDLLTGDIGIRLTDEQVAQAQGVLAELAAKEKLTDEEATASYDQLLALLSDEQKAKQDAIGLPFRRGGGGGGGGGGMAPPPEPDANPFEDADSGSALKSLLNRVGGTSTTDEAGKGPDSPASDSPPAEAPAPPSTGAAAGDEGTTPAANEAPK